MQTGRRKVAPAVGQGGKAPVWGSIPHCPQGAGGGAGWDVPQCNGAAMTAQQFKQRYAEDLAKRIRAAYENTGLRVWRGKGEPGLQDATALTALTVWETGVVPLSLEDIAGLLKLPYWFVVGFHAEWCQEDMEDLERLGDPLRGYVEFGRWAAHVVAEKLGAL